MQGVSAHDYAGRDITERISVTGSVDTSAAGTYTLTYTVSDEEGNSATAVRVITVVDEGEGPVQPEQPSDGTDADDPTHRPDQGNTGVPAQQGTLFARMADRSRGRIPRADAQKDQHIAAQIKHQINSCQPIRLALFFVYA